MNKRMKKWLAMLLGGILLLFSFSGCEKTGPIPNGKYIDNLDGKYIYAENSHSQFYWEIDGDVAQSWGSGSSWYKGNIVEKEGVIYFECYKWRSFIDIILGIKKRGADVIFIVDYNPEEKSITLTKIQNG